MTMLHYPELENIAVDAGRIGEEARAWAEEHGFCPDALARLSELCAGQAVEAIAAGQPIEEAFASTYLSGFTLGVLASYRVSA